MKKFTSFIAASLISAAGIMTIPAVKAGEVNTAETVIDNYYPNSGIVTEVDYTRDTVYVKTFSGITYSFTGTVDWAEGDIAALMLFNNKTPETVFDDIVVDTHYSGWVY